MKKSLLIWILILSLSMHAFAGPDEKIDDEKDPAPLELSPEEIEVLIKTACRYEGKEKKEAHNKLVAYGERAIPYILEHIGTDDVIKRRGIASLIFGIGLATVPQLIVKLVHEHRTVRYNAITLLGLFDAEEAIEPLRKIMNSDVYPRHRLEAARVLAKHGHKEGVAKSIIDLMQDESETIRIVTINIMDTLQDNTAAAALILALQDKYFTVRYPATLALSKLGKVALPELYKALETEKNAIVRGHLVRALGLAKQPEAIPVLVDLLKDKSWSIRAFAAEALGRLDDKSALEHLHVALTNEQHQFVIGKISMSIQSLENPVESEEK